MIAADARRGEVYFAVVGSPANPVVLPVGEAVNRLPEGSSFILGTGSEALITAAPPNRLVRLKSGDLPDARSFAARCAALPLSDTPPEPLYLRPPDAKPQAQPISSVSQPTVRQASVEEATLLAALHGECFDNAWTAAEFARLMAMPGAAAYLACEGDEPLAFLLARQAAGEGEILTIGTRPFARRRGIAGRLVSHLAEAMRKTKVSQLLIEVATDNAPGRALYASEGFTVTGRRKAYYEKPGGERQDAVVMMKTLVCPQGAAR